MDKDKTRILNLIVGVNEEQVRLDVFLAQKERTLSRTRFKNLIISGCVSVNGETLKDPNHRLTSGATVGVCLPEPEDPTPQAENIALNVIYEDDQLIVIDKPKGLVVHPAAGNWKSTLVNALIHHCGESLSGIGGVRRPGIVHRLDKNTTGLMVIAKNDHAHRSLCEQFADHGLKGPLVRAYRALVWGTPTRGVGTIKTLVGRSHTNRNKQAVVHKGGRHAVTHYKVEQTFIDTQNAPVASLVQCRLETGRTHQIRLHMAHIGCPLVGDTVYGSGYLSKINLFEKTQAACLKSFRRQALHAFLLGFKHPETGKYMEFQTCLPHDFASLLDVFLNEITVKVNV